MSELHRNLATRNAVVTGAGLGKAIAKTLAERGAGGNLKPATLFTDEEWNDTIAVNLSSTYFGIRTALNHMDTGGAIVNIASVVGFGAGPGFSCYSAAKAAVIADGGAELCLPSIVSQLS